ncbi:DUF1707 domain-containing protein [Rhodococcus sp. NPDC003318]|uniref:DUF1707 SHOCT-like domain-containing protein n=1 Tax=Rhodococcus sp. NPDC003318 TaxID=3364503 RepID=UPI0036C2F71C
MATTRMKTTRMKLRARDTDRVEMCGLLDTAFAEGQLTEAEHATRTARAMKAATFEQLGKLVDDLQIPSRYDESAVVRPDRRPRERQPGGGRRWAVGAGIVAVAAVVGALAGSCSDGGGFSSSSAAVPMLTTGDGVRHFVDDYRAHFGDTVADEVLLFPEHASVDRQSDTDPTRYLDYTYDGEFDSFGSDSSRSRDTPTLDLGAVDLAAIAPLVSGAPETLRMPDGEVSQIRFEYDTNERVTEPVVSIYVTDAFENSTYMVAGFDGEVLEVNLPTD